MTGGCLFNTPWHETEGSRWPGTGCGAVGSAHAERALLGMLGAWLPESVRADARRARRDNLFGLRPLGPPQYDGLLHPGMTMPLYLASLRSKG